jgi:anti-anti-sigma regulatory factor
MCLLSSRVGLRLAGEVDITNRDEFRDALAVLAVLASDGNTVVHLDVSRLGFIDVAGTRELIELMESHPPMHLILHDPPGSLRRIVALLWPGADVEFRNGVPGGG